MFAPTNAAFAALPAGTVDTLLKPENKPALTKVLTYHVVAGKMDAAALDQGDRRRRRQGDADRGLGRHADRDQERQHDHARPTSRGGMAHVTIADVVQSNGVIHVVDKVLLPK